MPTDTQKNPESTDKTPTEADGRSKSERFQLRSAPGPGGATLSKHATREAAETAKTEEYNKSGNTNLVIADMGFVGEVTQADRDAGKSTEQLQAERAAKAEKNEDPQGLARSVEVPV